MALRALNLNAQEHPRRVSGQFLGLEIKGRVEQARPLPRGAGGDKQIGHKLVVA